MLSGHTDTVVWVLFVYLLLRFLLLPQCNGGELNLVGGAHSVLVILDNPHCNKFSLHYFPLRNIMSTTNNMFCGVFLHRDVSAKVF